MQCCQQLYLCLGTFKIQNIMLLLMAGVWCLQHQSSSLTPTRASSSYPHMQYYMMFDQTIHCSQFFIKCEPLFYCTAMQRCWSFVHLRRRYWLVISRWNTHNLNSLEKSFWFLISPTVQSCAAVYRSKPNLTVALLSAAIFILAVNPRCALYSSDQSLTYSCFALCNPSRLHTLNWSSPWEAGSLLQPSQHGTHQQHTSGVYFPDYSQCRCKYHSCCWSVWLIGPPSAACDLTSSILSLHVLIGSIDSIIDFVLSRTLHYCFHPSMAEAFEASVIPTWNDQYNMPLSVL